MPQPTVLGSLVQGLKSYASVAKMQLTHNTVSQAYELAELRGGGHAKAVGTAVAAGLATFAAPPVMIGIQAVKDYKQKQQAEMRRNNVQTLASFLQSHGISPQGATEMANQVVMNYSAGYRISQADYRMWLAVAGIYDSSLIPYTSRIAERLESNKPQINLA